MADFSNAGRRQLGSLEFVTAINGDDPIAALRALRNFVRTVRRERKLALYTLPRRAAAAAAAAAALCSAAMACTGRKRKSASHETSVGDVVSSDLADDSAPLLGLAGLSDDTLAAALVFLDAPSLVRAELTGGRCLKNAAGGAWSCMDESFRSRWLCRVSSQHAETSRFASRLHHLLACKDESPPQRTSR
mmetsp:Transcript_13223/g.28001  ORF Transcript_13223/g.28001 Transcript_13223/m.28001 type:complete len:190 (-) Transcript_13223:344-913(-)